MERKELVIVGAGPAGLAAAIEASGCGLNVTVFDENARPGGQLFKQIHKFFGSREHQAGVRGFRIAQKLVDDARQSGAQVILDSPVIGVYPHNELNVVTDGKVVHLKADQIILATGASENTLAFPGWTLPGVIGAGAAQTMMNLHGVRPGNRILMIGSGNVGLVVTMQLLQAGCEVAAIVDASPTVGGYGVHAAKIARTGIPFYLSHTVVSARGKDQVESVTIAGVGPDWKPIPGTERSFKVDTICIAVGLTPAYQLASMAGCKMSENPLAGGIAAEVNAYGQTSIPGFYVAGDAAGIEEASSAMITGRITGAAAAWKAGYISKDEFDRRYASYTESLNLLRQGMFAKQNRKKPKEATDEGISLSRKLLQKGYLTSKELEGFVAYQGTVSNKGFHPVIECTQNIPCNPCETSCPCHCIEVGGTISALPHFVKDAVCSGCARCVMSCPGQAIFLVDKQYEPGFAAVKLPYEFRPLPEIGEKGVALDRSGCPVCEAEIVQVTDLKSADHTPVLTMKIPAQFSGEARFFRKDQIQLNNLPGQTEGGEK